LVGCCRVIDVEDDEEVDVVAVHVFDVGKGGPDIAFGFAEVWEQLPST
jgi:hypothetical protein